MNKLIFIFIMISLIGCDNRDEIKSIVLKSGGYVEYSPDEANIVIQIDCVDKSIIAAKNCLIEKSEKLNGILQKYGIREKDILTTRVELNKDFIWRDNSSVFNGYKASTTTNFKVRDLKILEDLYPELLTNEQFTIGGLSYQHSKIDSLNEAAYLKALENANRLADKIISTLPEENKKIIRISNVEISQKDEVHRAELKSFSEDTELDSRLPVNLGNMIAQKELFVEFKVY